MPPRKGPIVTYGRHRQRMITLEDQWLHVDGRDKSYHLFSSSSSGDSSIFNHSDHSSTTTTTRKPRQAKKKAAKTIEVISQVEKENVREPRQAKQKAAKCIQEISRLDKESNCSEDIPSQGRNSLPLKTQNFIVSSDVPKTANNIRTYGKKTADKKKLYRVFSLTDSNASSGADSVFGNTPETNAEQEKQNKGQERQRRAPTKLSRKKKVIQTEKHKEQKHKEHSDTDKPSFSEFDNYSLIISDSPGVQPGKPLLPSISDLSSFVSTSTPQLGSRLTSHLPLLNGSISTPNMTHNTHVKRSETNTSTPHLLQPRKRTQRKDTNTSMSPMMQCKRDVNTSTRHNSQDGSTCTSHLAQYNNGLDSDGELDASPVAADASSRLATPDDCLKCIVKLERLQLSGIAGSLDVGDASVNTATPSLSTDTPLQARLRSASSSTVGSSYHTPNSSVPYDVSRSLFSGDQGVSSYLSEGLRVTRQTSWRLLAEQSLPHVSDDDHMSASDHSDDNHSSDEDQLSDIMEENDDEQSSQENGQKQADEEEDMNTTRYKLAAESPLLDKKDASEEAGVIGTDDQDLTEESGEDADDGDSDAETSDTEENNADHSPEPDASYVSDAEPDVSDAEPDVSDAEPDVSDVETDENDVKDAEPDVSDAEPDVSDVETDENNICDVEPDVSDVETDENDLHDVEPDVKDAEPDVRDAESVENDVSNAGSDDDAEASESEASDAAAEDSDDSQTPDAESAEYYISDAGSDENAETSDSDAIDAAAEDSDDSQTRYLLPSNPPSTDTSKDWGECEQSVVSEKMEVSVLSTPPSCRRPMQSRLSLREVLTPQTTKTRGSRVLSAREQVLLQCDQAQPYSFSQCIPPSMMKKCVKIGEGVYGEVFRSRRNSSSIALKIIPIEGDFPVNDEPQKKFDEILPEIVISKELSALSQLETHMTTNFVQVKNVSVVKGRYPDHLLKQWDAYHKRKGSENDRPDKFNDNQLFIVFEFEDSGSDLESFEFSSVEEGISVLRQVAWSLAVAEQALQFEHRDLHWGNVLVKRLSPSTLVPYTLCGESIELPSHGVKAAIIDFTLSRLSKDGCHVYTDLSADPTLFEGHGDYQFDIYRLMKEENENSWSEFHPFSNVLWLHYLADKLLKGKTYKKPSSHHRNLTRSVSKFLRNALDSDSALDVLSHCEAFSALSDIEAS